jgi:hypothetical protein
MINNDLQRLKGLKTSAMTPDDKNEIDDFFPWIETTCLFKKLKKSKAIPVTGLGDL